MIYLLGQTTLSGSGCFLLTTNINNLGLLTIACLMCCHLQLVKEFLIESKVAATCQSNSPVQFQFNIGMLILCGSSLLLLKMMSEQEISCWKSSSMILFSQVLILEKKVYSKTPPKLGFISIFTRPARL